MAYCKVMTTRHLSAALWYGEHEKGCVKGGVNVPGRTSTALLMMRADAALYGKQDGVQGHIIIQSFDGRECSPAEANRCGQELAAKLAPGYRAMVYTHTESAGGNIHNHIVIESVNYQDGRKLDSHGFLGRTRAASDAICRKHGLSVIRERRAAIRYTQAEAGILQRGGRSWKDEMREAIEYARDHESTLDGFRRNLAAKGITLTERFRQRDKAIQWTYHGPSGSVRGSRLGDDYTRDAIIPALGRDHNSALERVEQERAERERNLQEQLRQAQLAQDNERAAERMRRAMAAYAKEKQKGKNHDDDERGLIR